MSSPPVDLSRRLQEAATLHRAGRLDEADVLLQQALAADPRNVPALRALVQLSAQRGQAQESVQWARRLVELQPFDADAHALLAVRLVAVEDADAAEKAYGQAAALSPSSAVAQNNHAVALIQCGRHAMAEAALRASVRLDPQYADAWFNLGIALEHLNQPEQALQAYLQAYRIRPLDLATSRQLVAMRLRMQDLDGAIDILLGTPNWQAQDAPQLCSVAVVLEVQGRNAESEHLYRLAIALDPELRPAHMNLAMLLLRQGRMQEGWAHYEYRGESDHLAHPPIHYGGDFKLTQWRGEPLLGKSILACAEQGYGDVIQFVRYCAELKALGAKQVVLLCFTPLRELLGTAPGVDFVVCGGDPVPVVDYWASLMSIPGLLGTRLDNIPARIPYLRTDPALLGAWRERLPKGRLKVGLAWRGSTKHGNDGNRSIESLAMLAPLWAAGDIQFISLQMGDAALEARTPPPGQPLLHLGEEVDTFAQAAALVESLDLLICVDTALAHVAGALGKPCWIMLSALFTDWRWLSGRQDSPWYPGTIRLFLQPKPGDWTSVITEVAQALRTYQPPARVIAGNVFAHTRRLVPLQVSLAQSAFREGLELQQANRLGEAESAYRRALALQPDMAHAHANLAVLLERSGRIDEAQLTYRKAIELAPGLADAHNNLGNLLAAEGRAPEAEQAYRAALALRPRMAGAHNNLGSLLSTTGRLQEAAEALAVALDIDPADAATHNNLGNLLRQQGHHDQAEVHLRRAVALAPGMVDGWINLGVLLKDMRRWADAEAACRQALVAQPQHIQAQLNLAMLLLSLGKYAQGWPLNEIRFSPDRRNSGSVAPRLPWPRWQGEPLAGRSLVIWPEQGFGDMIQFIRFAAAVRQLGLARLTVVCAEPLRELLATAQGVDAVVVDASTLDPHDFWSFPLSLPLYLKTTLDNIPATLPYLRVPRGRTAAWESRLPQGRPRVGVAWRGSSLHKNDANRSIPSLSELAPLWSVPHVRFVSLQKGPGQDEARQPPPGQPLTALGHDVADFSDLAAIISQLDLVICVDSAVAHLAGALGKPCWILLPATGLDWRWLHDRDDSPWYPGVVRLFRQPVGDDWSMPIRQAAAALQERFAAGPRVMTGSVLAPARQGSNTFEAAQAQLRQGDELEKIRQFAQAEAAYRRAIGLSPELPEAHVALGRLLARVGRDADAQQAFSQAIEGHADAASYHYLLGNLLMDAGERRHAVSAYRRALADDPRHAPAWNNLGLQLLALDHVGEAEVALRKAVALRPGHAGSAINLAVLLRNHARPLEAEQALLEVTRLQPGNVAAYLNLGALLHGQGRNAEAEAAMRKAIEAAPASVEAWSDLGILLRHTQRWSESEAAFRQALAIAPGNAQVRLDLAFLLLSLGRLREGWPLYEARLEARRGQKAYRGPAVRWPRWQGEPLQGRSLLLWPEQGLGDMIQLARYAPLLKQRGLSRLTIVCAPSLQRLVQTVPGVDAVATEIAGTGPHDYWSFSLSLPLHLATTLDSIPAVVPYLHPAAEDVSAWKDRLPATGPKVGIAWKGSGAHVADAQRSLPSLAALAPLWKTGSQVQFVSLQKGAGQDEALAPPAGQPLLACGHAVRDLAETAAIIVQLDLVICVDTSIAHLAGALGKPCWVLLRETGDWRWLLGREDSPWYPGTMRLFRQRAPGDWAEVVQRVATELAAFVVPQRVSAAAPATPEALPEPGPQKEAQLRQAIARSPRDPRPHNNLGILLQGSGRSQEAEAAYRTALALRPGHSSALHNLANLLRKSGRAGEAEPLLRECLSQQPGFAPAWVNLGAVLADLGRHHDSETAYRHAIALDPRNAPAHVNLGFLLLSLGRMQEGWPLMEARLWPEMPAAQSHRPAVPWPQWQGEPLAGKSLLLWPEQGLGDCIQFARFAALLKHRGASRLTLVCPAPLQAVMRTVPHIDAVVAVGEPLAPHDYWSFLLSLPLHLGTTLETLPARLPYVAAEPARVKSLRPYLPPGFKVGLVWQGSHRHPNDSQRSLPGLTTLAPLWRVAGLSFVSLQKEFGAAEMASLPPEQPLLALGPALQDFADTAAVVAQLDLLICVDTAVAHLAGAMGRPCWVLLPATSTDWRWLVGRDDSPWYPGVLRLFRQQRQGDWGDVIQRVVQALQQLVAAPAPEVAAPPMVAASAAVLTLAQTEQMLRLETAKAPGNADAWSNLGAVLAGQQRRAEAETALARALEIDPHHVPALTNRGALLAGTRRWPQAEASLRRALALAPEHADAQLNLCHLLLRTGRFEQAWPLHQARLASRRGMALVRLPDLPFPPWQGEALEGKSLLLWPEQGHGDFIQFIRFAPLLKQRGVVRLTVACHPSLAALARSVSGVDAVIDTAQDVAPHDFWSLLMSLPQRLATTLETVPAALPYLEVPADRKDRWKDRLPAGPRVGLVWKGSIGHPDDAQRSLAHLSQLAPLWAVPGIRFVSLQKGAGESEALAPGPNQPLLALGPELGDFADTAAVISQLDLLICVDTAVAHLAGALDKPVWVMLACEDSDWRWLQDREDSPWYPGTMRLFRQQQPGGWEPLVATVAQALADWAAQRPAAPAAIGQAVGIAQAHTLFSAARELHRTGKAGEAEDGYRRVLALRPDFAHASNNLGVLLQARRHFAEAETAYRNAIGIDPSGTGARNNLGLLLAETGRTREAESSYQDALAAGPDPASTYNNLGSLYLETGRLEQAQACFRKAIAIQPGHVGAHVNLGNLLTRLHQWAEAESTLQRAIALQPGFDDAWLNLGVLMRQTQRWEEAQSAYRRALALQPTNASAQMNLGFLLLMLGRFEEGWPLHEARNSPLRKANESKPPEVAYPQWRGEPLKGRSLLLWPEQGHGDWIQFVRYVPQLRALGVSRLTLVCQQPLLALLKTVPGLDDVLCSTIGIPAHDYWSFALSLPLHMRTTLETIPDRLPYLHAPPQRLQAWRERLPNGMRVGLAWKGAAAHKNDANRSLPDLAALLPLWQVPGVQFVSLQKGAGEDEARDLPQTQPLVALGHAFGDFADTAAVIAQLDLVICVDTAVAHLAGALGKPVWVLLPQVGSDWRWMTGRSDSPWYPGVMRLFRQSIDRDWTSVVAAVAAALRDFSALHEPAQPIARQARKLDAAQPGRSARGV